MADFNTGISPVNVPNAPNITPSVDTSTASAIESVSKLGGAVGGMIAKAFVASKAADVKKTSDLKFAEYGDNMARSVDTYHQGWLRADQVLSDMRLKTARMLASHPDEKDQDRINKIFNSVANTAGLGKEVVDSVNQDISNKNDIAQAAAKSALEAGFFKPTDSPEQQAYMTSKHQEVLLGASQMKAAMGVLALKSAQVGLQSAKVGLVNANLETVSKRQGIVTGAINQKSAALHFEDQKATHDFVAGARTMQNGLFQTTISGVADIKKQVADGTITKTEAIQKIQEAKAKTLGGISSIAVPAGAEGSITALAAPTFQLFDNAIDEFSGATDKTTLSNNYDNAVKRVQLQMLSTDRGYLNLVAATNMLPASAQALTGAVGNSFVGLLKANNVLDANGNVISGAKGGTPSPDGKLPVPGNTLNTGDKDHDLGVDQYFKMTRDAISKINAGSTDPKLKGEVAANFNNILRGVSKYGSAADDPSELNSVIRFFADPQPGAYIKAHPEAMSSDSAIRAIQTVQQNYFSVVLPKLREEYSNAQTQAGYKDVVGNNPALIGRFGKLAGPDMRNTPDRIHPQFNGTGVTFVPYDIKDQDARRAADKLNKGVAVVANRLIRASTHFVATTDYRSSYDEVIQRIVADGYTGDNSPVKTAGQVMGGK